MKIRQSIEQKLTAALSPDSLIVEDESHRHKGHGGHHPDGESHFSVTIVSAAFTGKSRVDRHRMVNTLLAEELSSRVHALRLSVKAPGEG